MGGSDGNGDRERYYRRARVGAAVGLFGVVILLALVDAASPSYAVDAIVFGLLLAAGLLLLGIDPTHLR